MAFFLVDLEFREKARHLLTTREVYLCFLFVVFALVNWSSVVSLASSLFGAGNQLEAPSSLAADTLTDAASPQPLSGLDGDADADGADTICNHHNHHTDCFNT